MSVALLHYWLVKIRGGEKVLQELCTLFPRADIYTHVYDPDATEGLFKNHGVKQTFIGSLPGSQKHYRHYLPLMPIASQSLNLKTYSLIVSNESGPIKGVVKPDHAVHICYCFTPMRYVWDMYDDYYSWASLPARLVMPCLRTYLKACDIKSARSVDHFVAISRFVAERIKRAYGRDSVVIYPPVDTDFFEAAAEEEKEDYYLYCGHLTRYKRPDIAVKAFNGNGRKLWVVGSGEDYGALRKIARGNITFLGGVSQDQLGKLYARAKALIFPGTEDFGIVPLEAQAAGTPVIAFKGGGALETVVQGETGLFFSEQSENSLCQAIEEFESLESSFQKSVLQKNARRFSAVRFRETFSSFVAEVAGKEHFHQGNHVP